MDPLDLALLVLILAGIWAVVEVALTVRRARSTTAELSRVTAELSEVVDEARPMIAKLDGVLDEVSPALAQLDPLLTQSHTAVEALTADLIEINGVIRDVAKISGSVSGASAAVSEITTSAAEKVQTLLGKKDKTPAVGDVPALEVAEDEAAAVKDEAPAAAPQYYTYTGESASPEEDTHE